MCWPHFAKALRRAATSRDRIRGGLLAPEATEKRGRQGLKRGRGRPVQERASPGLGQRERKKDRIAAPSSFPRLAAFQPKAPIFPARLRAKLEHLPTTAVP